MRLSPFRPAFWFCIALAVRLVYLFEQSASAPTFYHPLLDEAEMVDTARMWASGQMEPGPFFKAPLYPAMLAVLHLACGDLLLFVARLLQHLMGSWLVVIAFDLARRLSGPKRGHWAGALAAAFLAFNGPLVRLEGCLLLDFLAVFLQSASLWLICSALDRQDKTAWVRLVQAGAMAGLSWLNRPTLLPAVVVLSVTLFFLVRGKNHPSLRPAHVWLFPGFFASAVLIFVALNFVHARSFAWQPWQGGYNFYQANRLGANGRYLKQDSFVSGGGANPTRTAMIEGFARQQNPAAPPATFAEISSWWYNQGLAEIRKSPRQWVSLMFRKGVYLGSAREVYNVEDYGIVREFSSCLPWLLIGFGFILPFSLLSFAQPGLDRNIRTILWVYAIGLGGCIALFYTSGRLRMPLVFPAAVLAGAALAGMADLSGRRKIVATVLPAFGFFWAWGDWWGVRSEDFRAVEYARFSNAYWLDGQPEKALEMVDRATQADPKYPTLPQLRAQAFFALKRFAEAAGAFEEAAQRIPSDPSAPYNLGLILFRQLGAPEKSLPWFEEATRRDPSYADAAWMQVRTLFRIGLWTEARQRFDRFLLRHPQATTANLEAAYANALASQEAGSIRVCRENLGKAPWGDGRAREIEMEIESARKAGPR